MCYAKDITDDDVNDIAQFQWFVVREAHGPADLARRLAASTSTPPGSQSIPPPQSKLDSETDGSSSNNNNTTRTVVAVVLTVLGSALIAVAIRFFVRLRKRKMRNMQLERQTILVMESSTEIIVPQAPELGGFSRPAKMGYPTPRLGESGRPAEMPSPRGISELPALV
ncbi:hypothetical protein GGR58DRAFT_508856 [Xylaria digitata]|nr:hypothetical protein GGR58DRAFT_508856 [Xylaria digitata]